MDTWNNTSLSEMGKWAPPSCIHCNIFDYLFNILNCNIFFWLELRWTDFQVVSTKGLPREEHVGVQSLQSSSQKCCLLCVWFLPTSLSEESHWGWWRWEMGCLSELGKKQGTNGKIQIQYSTITMVPLGWIFFMLWCLISKMKIRKCTKRSKEDQRYRRDTQKIN